MHLRHLTPLRSLILVIALLLLGTSYVAGTHTWRRNTEAPSVQTLPATPVWSDEFEGPAGSAANPANWWNDVGGEGWGNNELQYYTGGTQNVALDGAGNLVITARKDGSGEYECEYGTCRCTSGRLLSQWNFSQQYGRYEARIKVPEGRGLLPAFWMQGNDVSTVGWPDSGEIDVMEVLGDDPGTVKGSFHGPGYNLSASHALPVGESYADDFHIYAIEWTPQGIAWFVDDVEYARFGPEDIGTYEWVADKPYFMMFSLAVGGDWPGAPDTSTEFPARMVVDYVRVYNFTNSSPTPRS